ncbi:MAG: secondary thiamine-phosphate synthase enzyme YjbQ [Candidatus Thiodiazotropha sp. (ex Lucina pensylvanica)]|nr:secondary thiamine-phosphate synthase enzyme YjbQ [Candidatus Thiodiazotropha sp. (ex Lucina pensylvanica)]MBT3052653.1 secondary thiamine-phosphate synthase enzyme YjbQ [Candidatus Thiodiazotropha sp. (ex Codakia orbicularis)]
MSNCYKILNISTGRPFEVCDITEQVESVVRESGVLEGTIAITSLHTTCAISVNENEERLFEDIRNFLLTIASPEGSYKHNDLHLRINIPPDEPENAHAHLIAMILGNGETVPLHDGALVLGRYQSILFLEMDGPRERTCTVQVVGFS